jgi:hypothetical protein
MKTPIQELIDKYSEHLIHDDDLDEMTSREVLKIVLVDLISYQIKEKECIIKSFDAGFGYEYVDGEGYYKSKFKQD